MIAFQTFLQKIQKGIRKHYGTDYDVEIHEVRKNNAVTYHGITVMHKDGNVAPTIYMEQFYREYMDGCPLSEVLQGVIGLYEKYKITEEVDMRDFLDFKQAGANIAYKLVHYEENLEELKRTPHIRFLDMAVVFYYRVSRAPFGNASIVIRRNVCGMWKISEKELYEKAKENTPQILPPVIRDMQEILSETKPVGKERNMEEADTEPDTDPDTEPDTDPDIEPDAEWDTEPDIEPDAELDMEVLTLKEKGFMYVLTNPQRQFGAACILYPDVLDRFAGKLRKNLYVLPSSVHEVILVPERQGMCAEAFGQIVREINDTQVEREEVLSDSVYYYDWKKKELMIAQKVCR